LNFYDSILQINLNGPAPVAIDMREFIQDSFTNEIMTLEGLIKYITDNRKFTVGYSPRDSEYHGPFSKTDLSPKNYDKFEGFFPNLLLKIKNTIINDFSWLEKKEFEIIFNRLICNLNFDNENVTSYIFNKNFFLLKNQSNLMSRYNMNILFH
jgi:hypothetical protein